MNKKIARSSFDKKFFLLIFQFFFSFAFLVWTIIFFAYHIAYRNKIIPHTFVGPFNISNRTPQEAYNYLHPKLEALNKQTLVVKINNQTLSVTLEDLGINYDTKATIIKAFQTARKNNFFQNINTEVNAWFKSQKLEPTLVSNEEVFSLTSQELFKNFEKPAKDAVFLIKEKELIITPSEEGFYLDRQKFKELVFARAKKIAFPQTAGQPEIVLPLISDQPKILESDLQPVKETIKNFAFNPPFFVFQPAQIGNQKTYRPSANQVLEFPKFHKNSKLEINIDKQKIENYIRELAEIINQPAKGQILETENNRVTKFSPSENGYEVDQKKAVELYSSAVTSYFSDKILQLALNLPVKVSPAPESPNEYGIKELLAEGVSNYKGSAPGRIHNLTLASSHLNGILIPPGKTFYFNRYLGDVSSYTDYKTAWIIKENRTVLGVGGGVCQVSTTVFRAALNAGLPIIERAAHAYRVKYYEYESSAGLDATVYPPKPDLVFTNDTPAYILITSEVDEKNTRLFFKIYGTNDGRTTEISEAKLSYQTPPPAPWYQEDPTLPKGVIKQIDFAAWGADITVYRKVYRSGEILQDDVFRSIYKPWQAVYLVGTG